RLAASVGLHLGELGLKMTSQALVPTYSSTFVLSSSIPDIFPFFGLSLERWKAGFATMHEAFEWVASSRFYVYGQVSDRVSRAKLRANRNMYHAFFQWRDARASPHAENESQPRDVHETGDREAMIESVREEALTFFGKREEHDALVRLKAMWNGRKVGEWTGGNGRVVGRGKRRFGEMTEKELKGHVLQTKEVVELQITEERQGTDGGH
ncbi:hypothetical protein F5148DRAFT_1217957, partial [Russula earlei]